MVFEGVAQNIGSWWASVNTPVGSAPAMTPDEYTQAAPFAGTSASDVVASAGERVSDFASSANNIIESANTSEPVQSMSHEEYHNEMPLAGSNPFSGIGSWWAEQTKPGNQSDDLSQGSTASAVEATPSAAQSNDFFGSIGKWFGDQAKPGNQPDDLSEVSVASNVGVNKIATGGDHFTNVLDTSTPANQKFTMSIQPTAQQITRADYTAIQDLGDKKTQDLIAQGYSPKQALTMQIEESKEAHNGRAVNYYSNELAKAAENVIAVSSEYHHDALRSGLPQNSNPFEYAGDLNKQFQDKLYGVANISGSHGLKPYGGSLLQDANALTKIERTGEVGPYNTKNLQSYSSAYGVLPLALQQAIGAQAAKSATEKGNGWEINPDAMDKYNLGMAQSAGFALKYKEAADNTLKLDDYKPTLGFEQESMYTGKDAEKLTVFNKGEDQTQFGVVDFGKNNNNAIDLTKVPGGDRSFIDNQLSKTTGGLLGTGETFGGFTLQNIGLTPLTRRGTAMAGVYRRSVITYPFSKRKHIVYKKKPILHVTVEKPKSKILNIESLNKQVMPKRLGSELFKFKIGASDKVMKPMSARNISSVSKINSIADNFKIDNVGINLSRGKSMTSGKINVDMSGVKPFKNKPGNINLDIIGVKPSKSHIATGNITTGIKLPKNKSGVTGNIKNIMDEAVKAVKLKPMRK